MLQAQTSDHLRNSRAPPTLPLGLEANIRAWVWDTTPETPTRHESKANIVVLSDDDSIHGDFDAVHTTPKNTVPTPTTSRPFAAGNAYCFRTPITAKDFSAGRSTGQPHAFPSANPDNTRSAYCFPTPRTGEDFSAGRQIGGLPAFPAFSSTSPANNANRPTQRSLLPPPLSGAQKRQLASEASPVAQDPKRQRMLSSVPADLPQVKTIAGPLHHCETQFLPVIPADTVVSISGNKPTSNAKTVDRVDLRKSKGPGLRINTQAAGFAAPLPPRTGPTHLERLYADFIRTHKVLREELDHLTHELRAANERAHEAELRARKAENMGYQANVANFQKLRELENKHKVELQNSARKYNTLATNLEDQERKNKALEMRCRDLSWTIEKAKEELGQERQTRLSAFLSEHTKTTQELGRLNLGRD